MIPFFSIVIPLYNKQNFIANTVQSVLNQDFSDFELLIIDDCSTDKSKYIATQFNDSRIKIISHQINKGLSATRNTGIKIAASKFIAFLDADDLWKPSFLSEISHLITKFPEASLYATNYEEIIDSNSIVLPSNGADNFENYCLIDNYFKHSLQQPLYCPSSFCVKKEVFETVGYYNESITFGEDVDFNIRANLLCKIAYTKIPLSQYTTQSENQITQSNLSSKIITDFDFYEKKYPDYTLKKFLDFHRYIKAKMYKMEGNKEKFYQLKKGINLTNLNWKQIILLHVPAFLLNKIKKWKVNQLNKGRRFTSYN